MGTALNPDDLAKLPPGIQQVLQGQQSGAGAPDPNLDQLGGSTVNDLNSAIQRRFGQDNSFDPTYDSGLRGLLGEIPIDQRNYEQSQQRTNEDFMTTAQKLAQGNDRAVSGIENTMANNGMGYSGAHLVAQQRQGQDFQNSVFSANQARARGLSDATQRMADAYQTIRSRESDLQAGATERARVRDEAAAWAKQQQQLELQRQQQEQANAQTAMQQQQQQAAANEAALKQLEAQSLAMSQPVPAPTGQMQPVSNTGFRGVASNPYAIDWSTPSSQAYNAVKDRQLR